MNNDNERELFESTLSSAERFRDPLRPDTYFTEHTSYRWELWQEYRAPLLARIAELEAAAGNLIAVKGRHNTEIAYKRLESALKREGK